MLLTSCGEGVIVDVPLKDQSGKVVIEGNLTDEDGPYVVTVSKSMKMSDASGYPPVTNAEVIVSDNNGQTETLSYANGVYTTKNFQTNYGDTYTLSVKVDGTIYKATSRMPENVELEGLQQTMVSFSDNIMIGIIPLFKDPAAQGNYYLFRLTNGKRPEEMTVMNDNIGNGKDNEKPIYLNHDPKKNDTIIIEMQNIDGGVYNYFKSLPQANLYNSGGASPVNPPSNISNGALGYFSAHTVDMKATIIK